MGPLRKFYKYKRGKHRRLLSWKMRTAAAMGGIARKFPKGVRASKYKRKNKSKALMSVNVAKFFKIPPREFAAALKSTNIICRLYEAGGTGTTKGLGYVQFNPMPITGKQITIQSLYPDNALTAKTYGITQYFGAYDYCVPYGMKVVCSITNHSSETSCTVVLVPMCKPADLWNGATITDLITRPEAKSFILGNRGQNSDRKTVKIMLKTKDFQEAPPEAYKFDSRGKPLTTSQAQDADQLWPFIFAVFVVANPLRNSDKERNAIHADIKAKVKYYVKFTNRKANNVF